MAKHTTLSITAIMFILAATAVFADQITPDRHYCNELGFNGATGVLQRQSGEWETIYSYPELYAGIDGENLSLLGGAYGAVILYPDGDAVGPHDTLQPPPSEPFSLEGYNRVSLCNNAEDQVPQEIPEFGLAAGLVTVSLAGLLVAFRKK